MTAAKTKGEGTKAPKKQTTSKRRPAKSSTKTTGNIDVNKTPTKDRPSTTTNDKDEENEINNNANTNDNDNEYDSFKNDGIDMSPMKRNEFNENSTDIRDKNKYKYRVEIQQMMFVSGETNEPPERTTDLIEEIVRDQVVALIMQAYKTTQSRGQKSILPEDLIFLIRHDKAKVNRLRTYLSWKDVRKNAKEQENGDLAAAGGSDLLDDAVGNSIGNVDNKLMASKQKKSLKLPWEMEFMFAEQSLSGGLNGNMDDEKIDEEEREAVLAQIKRLKQNDERTKDMTQQEYVHWSECRQASFTFRKGKRFREWCGLSQITESRPNDDVIDILGFLTFEMVCSITEEALKVKSSMDKLCEDRDTHRYLFMEPSNDSRPISVEHVQEAWRKLQDVPKSKAALYNFSGGRILRNVRLI
jgi:transcription initiation protein SPT3